MTTRSGVDDSRTPLRILALVVSLTTLASLLTVGIIVRTNSTEVVQGSELDLAGRQRRLTERIALDVEVLRSDPGRDDVREELVDTANQLDQIRRGLLAGDASRDLDGVVPAEFRRLYSPDGLDLSNRLRAVGDAARRIADGRGSVDRDVAQVIADEAEGQRIVIDLNEAVESLSTRQEEDRARNSFVSVIGLLVAGWLGVVALVTLRLVRRRIDRQNDERRSLEAVVADSEEIYRTTVNSLIDGVVVQDDAGHVVQINDAARRIIAAHADVAAPARGVNFAAWLPEMIGEDGQPLARAQRPVPRALEGTEPVVGVIVGLPFADAVTWFRCNATAVESREGQERRVVLTFADITAERRMEAALREEEQRFRSALEHAPIGMALVSARGEFITVNAALCRLTGRTRDDLLGGGLAAISRPDRRSEVTSSLRSLLDDGIDTTTDLRQIVASDGSTVDVEVAISVIRPSAGVEPYFIIDFLDVTDVLRAAKVQEDALRREQQAVAKLLALDETRSAFLSTVSHELRTPLTSLVGYLEMLEDGSAGGLSDQQVHMVHAAVRNGVRLGRLIDDLLAMTAADQSGDPKRDLLVDVPSLVTDVLETIAPLADRAGLTIRSQVDATCAIVAGDRSELERVLLNVVGNAVKFTPPGGRIDVSASEIDEPVRSVEIRVTDTGPGIPADEQDQLFTRFFRSADAQRNQIPGTGLGLAIAAKIVEQHNGRITLSSVELEGTCVVVRLPLATTAGGAVTS